jgi:hypothetical protein
MAKCSAVALIVCLMSTCGEDLGEPFKTSLCIHFNSGGEKHFGVPIIVNALWMGQQHDA